MTHVNPHADVWLIHQDKACLLRQDPAAPSGWQQEMSMPFGEFMGSAIALSSFTQPDTRVFYNLSSNTANHESNRLSYLNEEHWLGIKEDPLRLLQVTAGDERQEIKSLQSMGKKAHVISCVDPAQFERATPMILINPREKKHLEKWLAARREGAGKHRANLGLLVNLWSKPEPAYQTLRLVAMCCTFFSLTIAHHMNEVQRSKELDYFAQDVQQALKKGQENSVSTAWTDWGIQLGKFGKDKRANLNAVNIQWNEEGHVYTQATLSKDRKRVPKGCTLETPRSATCSTKGLAR